MTLINLILVALTSLVLISVIYLIFLLIKRQKSILNEDKISLISTEAVNKSLESAMPRVKEIMDLERKNIHIDLDNKNRVLNELVKEIKADINRSGEERVKSFTALKTELEGYKQVTGDLKMTTDKLRNLLSNNQLRGAFGEQVAENLLKMSGFVIGQDYVRNEALSTKTRPDITIFLPDKTKINIDVKFPYDSLVKTIESEDEMEKKKYFQLFKQDVKTKIKQVCTRDYINPDENTVDFVILFIPNEMIFSYIYENMPDVWEEAMHQKVVLAGPFSFTAILRMVKQAYTNFRYQENLKDIIILIKKFDKEFNIFSESVDKLGERIRLVSDQFEKVDTTRSRQLGNIVERIKSQSIQEEQELIEESSNLGQVNS